MFDMHLDLLTLAYMAKRQNKYPELQKMLDNITWGKVFGIGANLYFMSPDEMGHKLKYPSNINVLLMFKEAVHTLESFNFKINLLYSIEGCDYIQDERELEALYQAGLDAIILTWNTPNKYGSGNRSTQGLTALGRTFIQKAIDLGLAIDLSHANEATFKGIIDEIAKAQRQHKDVICYASHSNIRSLYDHPRNLNDEQLKLLKSVGGYLGLVAYPPFLTNQTSVNSLKKAYIDHIIYAANLFGVDHIFLASDNMEWLKSFDETDTSASPLFSYNVQVDEINKLLSFHFKPEDIQKIMHGNANKIYAHVKSKKNSNVPR